MSTISTLLACDIHLLFYWCRDCTQGGRTIFGQGTIVSEEEVMTHIIATGAMELGIGIRRLIVLIPEYDIPATVWNIEYRRMNNLDIRSDVTGSSLLTWK